jgi:hypothetical protein
MMTKQYQNNKNRKDNKRTAAIRKQEKQQKRAYSAPGVVWVDFV